MMAIKEELKMHIGGRYLVKIADEGDTIGIYKGYISIGEDVAIAIEPENSLMRFIPVSQIVYIDQLEIPSIDDVPDKKSDIYYR